ncbi:MAG: ACT domain-containing protein [Anaerolineae bacterium]|nr:ACT domain-containing protein [Anaerolineae bacterium]
MSGERNLDELLRQMRPALDPQPYTFATLEEGAASGRLSSAWGFAREDEGVMLILTCEQAQQAGMPCEDQWGRITLSIHSDLHAVGLLAHVSQALASQGISLNVISAFYHDHLFVPWQQRRQALNCLSRLSRQANPPS